MLVDLRRSTSRARNWKSGWTRCASPSIKIPSPNDPQSPFVTSGIRIGTPAVTSRGFGTEDMAVIAEYIKRTAADF